MDSTSEVESIFWQIWATIAAMSPLEFTTDPFAGVTVVPASLPDSPEEFAEQLNRSLKTWVADRYRLAWLRVPIEKAAFMPLAVAAGFVFHHAEASYVMMTRQLVEGAFVPPNASHSIGAGGVVISDANELLVVVEKYNARPNFYKLPGGLIHQGEHIVEGVMREVLEETGVHTQFDSVVCFRHQHNNMFGKTNIYFVCRLSPISKDITIDESEIAEARWMPVEEYLTARHISPFNQHIVRSAMERPGAKPNMVEGYIVDPVLFEIFTS